MILLGLLVVLLFVVDHAKLRVNQGVRWVDLSSFEKCEGSCFQIISSEILHAHVEVGLRTAREESDNSAVDAHGLVRLILDSKGVGHANPGIQEGLIKNNSFLEVLSGYLIFLTVKVVGPHCEPADRVRTIVLDEVMCAVVELSGKAEVK